MCRVANGWFPSLNSRREHESAEQNGTPFDGSKIVWFGAVDRASDSGERSSGAQPVQPWNGPFAHKPLPPDDGRGDWMWALCFSAVGAQSRRAVKSAHYRGIDGGGNRDGLGFPLSEGR